MPALSAIYGLFRMRWEVSQSELLAQITFAFVKIEFVALAEPSLLSAIWAMCWWRYYELLPAE